MLQTLYLFLFACLFLSMILFPTLTFEGACNGLVLWFQTILPTLLPFVIISNLLISTNLVHMLSQKLGFVFQKIFRVTPLGSYPIVAGFLCGYPMGAKTIADMVKTNLISKNEGQYLLSFCNNTSPMFIISYLVIQNLQDSILITPCLMILLGTPILCSFIFRIQYPKPTTLYFPIECSSPKTVFRFAYLDQAIMNGFETITRVGGYIILFSIIFSLAKNLPYSIFVAFLEITNGIPLLLNTTLSYEIRFAFCLSLVSFGGLCSVIQTRSMIQDSGLSIRPYIKEKLITAMVTSLIAYLYILFIHS